MNWPSEDESSHHPAGYDLEATEGQDRLGNPATGNGAGGGMQDSTTTDTCPKCITGITCYE